MKNRDHDITKFNKRDEKLLKLALSMILEVADIRVQSDRYYEWDKADYDKYVTDKATFWYDVLFFSINNSEKFKTDKKRRYMNRKFAVYMGIDDAKRKNMPKQE